MLSVVTVSVLLAFYTTLWDSIRARSAEDDFTELLWLRRVVGDNVEKSPCYLETIAQKVIGKMRIILDSWMELFCREHTEIQRVDRHLSRHFEPMRVSL